jgi:hypothetical protein
MGSARVGNFSIAPGTYGGPSPIARPLNNVATVDPVQKAADDARAATDRIYEDLLNLQRKFTPAK